MKRVVLILIALLTVVQASTVTAATRVTRREPSQQELPIASADGIEIYGSNGVITIKSDHKATVRVFTILGQLVSTTNVQPGTSRIKVTSRGIYIVKVGNITQKVAL